MRPFKHPSVVPQHRGIYLRDWRGTRVLPETERRLSVDLWEPVEDRADSLYPGVWYFTPGWNDATDQRLPWRELTEKEMDLWRIEYEDEYRTLAD